MPKGGHGPWPKVTDRASPMCRSGTLFLTISDPALGDALPLGSAGRFVNLEDGLSGQSQRSDRLVDERTARCVQSCRSMPPLLGSVAGDCFVDVVVGEWVHDVLVREETVLVVFVQADAGQLKGVTGEIGAMPHPEDTTLGAII